MYNGRGADDVTEDRKQYDEWFAECVEKGMKSAATEPRIPHDEALRQIREVIAGAGNEARQAS